MRRVQDRQRSDVGEHRRIVRWRRIVLVQGSIVRAVGAVATDASLGRRRCRSQVIGMRALDATLTMLLLRRNVARPVAGRGLRNSITAVAWWRHGWRT
ncbi:hypothetical protein MPSYJ_42650 [Mycolicibacterium psychrotolerans]|uniref:Uncharacterized protein n=1 Tax=Mycolicibacterium psychrotolerans TaxID=216929 RepID=A0A7I7MER1_9MYCO|nr:hypothetical protein MPSYJ_42650 [Mycolicibacterium psychrotolerans]